MRSPVYLHWILANHLFRYDTLKVSWLSHRTWSDLYGTSKSLVASLEPVDVIQEVTKVNVYAIFQ
jgi:hypothetical protein